MEYGGSCDPLIRLVQEGILTENRSPPTEGIHNGNVMDDEGSCFAEIEIDAKIY